MKRVPSVETSQMFFRTLPLVLSALLISVAPSMAPAESKRNVLDDLPQLDRAITFSGRAVYLGEILNEISDQAGVKISVRQQSALTGIRLSAFLQAVSARACLTSIGELLTSRFHRAFWTADRGSAEITLCEQPSFSEAARVARQAILESWATDLRLYRQIASQPDDLRVVTAKGQRRLFPTRIVSQERLDLVQSITPSELDGIIRGETVKVKVSSLSARAQGGLSLGLSVGPPPGVEPRLYMDWSGRHLGPLLLFDNGIAARSLVGGPGWDAAWTSGTEPEWKTIIDPGTEAFRQLRDSGGRVGDAASFKSTAYWLEAISKKHRIQLIADPVMAGKSRAATSVRLGTNSVQALYAVVANGELVWRAVAGVQLLRGATMPVEDRAHLVPWRTVSDLRKHALGNDGYLPLDDLLVASRLSEAQLQGLEEEFPGVTSVRRPGWPQILSFWTLLNRDDRQALESEQGVTYTDCDLKARFALEATPVNGDARGLHLIRTLGRGIRVSLRLTDQNDSAQAGFPSRARQARKLEWQVRGPGFRPYSKAIILLPRAGENGQ